MIFGIFQSWKKKSKQSIQGLLPFIGELNISTELTRIRIDSIKQQLLINEQDVRNIYCLAFLIGSIESDLQQYISKEKLDIEKYKGVVLSAYGYSLIERDEVKDDRQWASEMSKVLAIMSDNDSQWYWRLGLASGGYPTEKSESGWDLFVEKLRAYA